METIYHILGTSILALFITRWFEPIQSVKERFLTLLPAWVILTPIHSLLTCGRCLAFWVYLIIYHNVEQAAIASVIAYLISHMIDKIEAWYE